MRIDSTYFIRERRLPDITAQVGTPTALLTDGSQRLTDFINYYEPEFLKLILGDELYAEYSTGFATPKWAAFDALMVNTTLKDSPIADYVYCMIVADMETEVKDGTHIVNVGDGRISAVGRITDQWNRMVTKLDPILEYLSDNTDTFCATYEYNYIGWTSFTYENRYGI